MALLVQELHEALQAKDQAIAQLRQQVMLSEDSSADEGGSKLEQANRRISNLQAQVGLPREGTYLTWTCSGAQASGTWCSARHRIVSCCHNSPGAQLGHCCGGREGGCFGVSLDFALVHVSFSMLQAGSMCRCPVTL